MASLRFFTTSKHDRFIEDRYLQAIFDACPHDGDLENNAGYRVRRSIRSVGISWPLHIFE
jgi:hypothetical protein